MQTINSVESSQLKKTILSNLNSNTNSTRAIKKELQGLTDFPPSRENQDNWETDSYEQTPSLDKI